MKLKGLTKKSLIPLGVGVAVPSFLPMIWVDYAYWENKIRMNLVKAAVENTDLTNQTAVNSLNTRIKLVHSAINGTLSMGLAFGIDSVMSKKVSFNPMLLGLSFALGFVVRFAVPNPKVIPYTVMSA